MKTENIYTVIVSEILLQEIDLSTGYVTRDYKLALRFMKVLAREGLNPSLITSTVYAKTEKSRDDMN